MSTILIHAGMPKTGSTSIQSWLRRHSARLRDECGKTVVVQRDDDPDDQRFSALEHGPFATSNRFLLHLFRLRQVDASPERVARLSDDFGSALVSAADEHGDVIVTAETFADPILTADPGVLDALQMAAAHHTVQVVLYVRPQHDAIEARWRQWGYHSATSPSTWWHSQLPTLHYRARLDAAAAVATDVSFDARPFRRDLLRNGDVVADFVHNQLGLDYDDDEPIHENPGLSLDLTILLHGAGPEVSRSPIVAGAASDWGRRQVTLARVTSGWGLPVSAQAQAARTAIHRLAYQEFAADNRSLVERAGWGGGEFIARPDPGSDDVDPTDLDRLLAPTGDPVVVEYFRRAIAELCAAHEASS